MQRKYYTTLRHFLLGSFCSAFFVGQDQFWRRICDHFRCEQCHCAQIVFPRQPLRRAPLASRRGASGLARDVSAPSRDSSAVLSASRRSSMFSWYIYLQRWVSTKSSISQLECILIFYNIYMSFQKSKKKKIAGLYMDYRLHISCADLRIVYKKMRKYTFFNIGWVDLLFF